MKSTYNFITSNNDLKNVHIAISGVGKVGSKLAKILAKVGAKITAASINVDPIKKLKNEIKLTEVNPEDLFITNCDIISPCALGGAINQSNVNLLKCRAIVGAANNQLKDTSIGQYLHKKKIIYSPDYLVNSGGVIAIASEINKIENLLENS